GIPMDQIASSICNDLVGVSVCVILKYFTLIFL
ncbi:MAG: hypothetical protein ACI9FN_003880, partial [Saprospiraceae bacterium]